MIDPGNGLGHVARSREGAVAQYDSYRDEEG
jgi:hypothetical protein